MTVYFIDLESTGLDMVHDRILEVGVLALSDDLQTEIAAFERLVDITPGRRRLCPPIVQDLHTASGLWADLDAGLGMSDKVVRHHLAAFLGEHADAEPTYRWGGSGVNHFDSGMLAFQWPEIRDLLHYRADYDVSPVRAFATKAGISEPFIEDGLTAHRALDDCRIAWAQARYYLDRLRAGREPFDTV